MKPQSNRVALGCRAHSGWAVVVTVAGWHDAVKVIDRRRIEIADPKIAGSKQPYHAAAPLDLKNAEVVIQRCAESTGALARQALRSIVEEVGARGYEPEGRDILLGSGRPATTLAATL